MHEAHEAPRNDVIYQGSVLRLRVATQPLPQGGVTRYEIVDHPGVVAIVALRQNPQGNEPLVALVRQRRPAIGADTWELPAGLIDQRDQGDPLRAAQRELREETGYAATEWRPLAHEYSSPGFTNEVISLFLAVNARPASGATPDQPTDPSEIAGVRWEPLDSALTLALSRSQNGAIADGKTLLGLSLARDLWRQSTQATATTATAATQSAPMSPTTTLGGSSVPRDVTNMPYARNAPYAQEMREQPAENRESGPDATLKLDNMLLEEFNYAGTTAYQAIEDRARMFNLYLLLIGVLGSGLAAIYQLGGGLRAYTQILALGLFLIAGILGIAFFIKLIRLRQAWRDSALAMNEVKEYYIREFTASKPNIADAFRWRLETMPLSEKHNVTSVVSSTVGLLSGLCFAGAAFIATQAWLNPVVVPQFASSVQQMIGVVLPLAVAVVVLLIAFLAFVSYYQRAFDKQKELKRLREVGNKFGLSITEMISKR